MTLENGATANRARYRTKGDTVEIELHYLRTIYTGYPFVTLPASIRPTGLNDVAVYTGYNTSTSLPVLISVSPNGQLRTITDNTTNNILIITIQYKIF